MQASFAILLESQDFKETAESIEDFMKGPILREGGRGEPPLQVDVFLLCLKARYLFLTKFLLGRVALSMQVVQQVPVLAAVQKFRMTNSCVDRRGEVDLGHTCQDIVAKSPWNGVHGQRHARLRLSAGGLLQDSLREVGGD